MPVIEYRIHPSVGIARMGDSATAFFVGAERPNDQFAFTLRNLPGAGGAAPPATGLRDAAGKLAKQAARFRIFAYSYEDYIFWRDDHPSQVWEVTGSDDYEITWTVQVANLKSYAGDPDRRWKDGRPTGSGITEKPNDPAGQTLASNVAGSYTAVKRFQKAGRLQLGSAALDDQSNADGNRATLLVIGSDGAARAIPGQAADPADVTRLFRVGWEDDAADGPVRATVTPKPTSTRPDAGMGAKSARDAWVVINLPDYGMDIEEPGSLYETALNHGTYHANRGRSCCFKRDFFGDEVTLEKHLMPILKSYLQLRYVSQDVQAQLAHEDFDLSNIRGASAQIFPRMRMPVPNRTKPGYIRNPGILEEVPDEYGPNSGPDDGKTMPQQKYFSIPRLLHGWMARWKAATLPMGSRFPPARISAKDRPELMDMAALQTMNGGSFLPGLEVGRHAALWQSWMADYGAKPGSVDIRIVGGTGPGTLTHYLAVTWQTDFLACLDGWWPASRPERTRSAGPADFKNWMTHPGDDITNAEDLITHWSTLGFVRKTGGSSFVLGDEFLDDRPAAVRP